MPPEASDPRIRRVLSRSTLRQLLEPFGLNLEPSQEDCLLTYLELLLRWNSRINLVGPATAEECVSRHFAESLHLSRYLNLHGRLLDIGSGAGFPGLALKIVQRDLAVTLLEPVAKKRAFLKEAARACQMSSVEVLPDRVDVFANRLGHPAFDFVTARAVGGMRELVSYSAMCLKQNGFLCLWIGRGQSANLLTLEADFDWREPLALPLSRSREIWVGRLRKGIE
mgnify:CR=1 FL=1